jgi:ABC-type proline/glycine betaine transport system substrate-binding protein
MKAFIFSTKSDGTVIMCPPTIGVMRIITDFIKHKEEKKESSG